MFKKEFIVPGWTTTVLKVRLNVIPVLGAWNPNVYRLKIRRLLMTSIKGFDDGGLSYRRHVFVDRIWRGQFDEDGDGNGPFAAASWPKLHDNLLRTVWRREHDNGCSPTFFSQLIFSTEATLLTARFRNVQIPRAHSGRVGQELVKQWRITKNKTKRN